VHGHRAIEEPCRVARRGRRCYEARVAWTEAPAAWLLAWTAAVVGGGINAIAGGGTILTYPALLALGLGPIEANATSAVALWPGGLGGALGLREGLRGQGRQLAALALPAALGGGLGALALLRTPPEAFRAAAPVLVLAGTLTVGLRPAALAASGPPSRARRALAGLALLAVSAYGGFFGAGLGFLVLGILGALGGVDVLGLSAAKNVLVLLAKGVAVAGFLAAGAVDAPLGLAMASGALLGGALGARVQRRLGPDRTRRGIVALGVAVALALILDRLGG
jgi:uncharacterized membrane protein YfcA